MNKTSIEWIRNPDFTGIPERDAKGRFQYQGYTWNPLTGCLNHDNGLCKGGGFPCYAFKLANGRLKQRYLANQNISFCLADTSVSSLGLLQPFYPRFWEERLEQPMSVKKPSGIFVCDMSDLFGVGVPEQWTYSVMNFIEACPQHRFYLLTKQPQNLIQFNPFPENCWVGVTATSNIMFAAAYFHLMKVEASVKYVSLEPLLAWDARATIPMLYQAKQAGISWLIIGACTGTKKDMEELCKRYPNLTLIHWKGNIWTAQPRIVDLREIVEAADKAGTKVFLKDNLDPLLRNTDGQIPTGFCDNYGHTLRQELPE